jgi:putative cardiolipin synthase
MDRRSAHCNTEMGLIVNSPVLAEQVIALMRGERMPGSYQVRRGADPTSLQWVAAGGAGDVVLNAEPKSTWQVQLKMSMLQLLVSEEWL